MITNSGKYYLYRHIRLDTNQVFYVGSGTKYKKSFTTFSSEYKRAFDFAKRRSAFWRKVVDKAGYRIEILMESDDYEFIKEKEIEFISLYGRKDLGLGTLVNLTDGGEGTLGIVYSEERNRKISLGNTGKIRTEIEKENISKRLKKKVIHKETGKVFDSIMEASASVSISCANLYQQLWNCSKICEFKYEDECLNFVKKIKEGRGKKGKSVIHIESGQEFSTITEACLVLKLNRNQEYCNLKTNSINKKFLLKPSV